MLYVCARYNEQHTHMDILNTPASIGHRPASLRSFRHHLTKAQHLSERDRCIGISRQCDNRYLIEYEAAAAKYGVGISFTGNTQHKQVSGAAWVSGGTWSHWPDAVKQQVAQYSRASFTWKDRAYAHHHAAGKRHHTLRDMIGSNILK